MSTPADGGGKGRLGRLGASLREAVADAQTSHSDLVASNQDLYGSLVKKGTFGIKTVEVYSGGYVRVGLMLTARSPYERLRSVKFSHQVQDRSGLGHLWTSGGLGSREKRVLLLVVSTDEQVHTLSTEGMAGRSEDKLGLALEAAGNGVVQGPAQPAAPAATASPAEQLRQVADLHRDGVLSDEEFAAAKAKLLGQL